MRKSVCPPELKRLYRRGAVLPFVGAGASMSVKWGEADEHRGPSWSEMVNKAAEILGYEDPELLRFRGSDLQILEYFKVKKKNFAPLTNWLYSRLNAPSNSLRSSKLHNSLVKLETCRTLYTTNYDDFLERSFSEAGKQVHTVATEEDMAYSGSGVQIVKFHGDFNNPDQMVMSEADYYDRMRLNSPMDLKLLSDLMGRAVLFVGYSFRDINIAYLFQSVDRMFRRLPNSFSGRRAYIIVHNPSDFENRLFHQRNMEVIPTYGEDRGQATTDILEDLVS